MTSPAVKIDVLIIGAGPAGLMCANALVHAGIDVRIVDKRFVFVFTLNSLLMQFSSTNRAVGVSAGQADGIQPRTTEVLQVSIIVKPLILYSTSLSRVMA